jgi:hypothetical protein
VTTQLAAGFPFLPAGCQIDLDRQSQEIVLASLKDAARHTQWRNLVDDLRGLPGASLADFLDQIDRSVEDLYRRQDRSWTRLQRELVGNCRTRVLTSVTFCAPCAGC